MLHHGRNKHKIDLYVHVCVCVCVFARTLVRAPLCVHDVAKE
jgi:hypothetical protein